MYSFCLDQKEGGRSMGMTEMFGLAKSHNYFKAKIWKYFDMVYKQDVSLY